MIKTRSDRSIEQYKAHLVTKSLHEYEINYEEAFALVARISSLHAFLAIAVPNKWDFF